MLYINEVVGTYSYFVNLNSMLGTRIPSSRKIVQYKTMVLYAGFFPCIRPWSYKRVVLCSGKTGTPYILSTYPRARRNLFVRFAVQPAAFEIQGCSKLEMQRTPIWSHVNENENKILY